MFKRGLAQIALGLSIAVGISVTPATALPAEYNEPVIVLDSDIILDNPIGVEENPTDAVVTDEPSLWNENSEVIITEDSITVDGTVYSRQEIEALLALPTQPNSRSGTNNVKPAAAPALAAGAYFIPGVGQILLGVTGAIVIGGITIYAGGWLYDKIKTYLRNSGQAKEISDARNKIPNYCKDKDGNIDMKKFKKRNNQGNRRRYGPKDWYIEKSTDAKPHRGATWKVFNPNKQRVASIKDSGEIVGK